jgi:MFS family permease
MDKNIANNPKEYSTLKNNSDEEIKETSEEKSIHIPQINKSTNELKNKVIVTEPQIEIIKNNEVSNPLPLMDQLVEQAGYTKAHFYMISFACLILFLDGIQMTLFSSTFIPFQKLYNLSQFYMSLISSSMFLAVGLGSFLTTKESMVKNRKDAIIKYTFLMFIMSISMGLFQNLFIFILCRLIIGICIGILLPMNSNLLCEFLPIKFRSFFMVMTGTFFNLGAIFLNSVMYFVIPNFEQEKLLIVYLIVSFPNLIVAIIMYLKLEESPRYLIIHHREQEGFEILEKIIKRNLNHDEKRIIVTQLRGVEDHRHIKKSIKIIFDPKYQLITVILMALWVINSFVVYGGSISMSLVLKYIEEANGVHVQKISSNLNIIKDQIMIYAISLPGNFLAAFMTESQYFGRKKTIFTGFLFIGIFTLFSTFNLHNFHILNGLAGLFISLSFSGCSSFTSEVYPTKIRNQAVGFLYLCTRISGFSSQFIAIWLFKVYYLGMCYASIFICFFACVFTYLLPYDTHGKPLDCEEVEIQENKIIL